MPLIDEQAQQLQFEWVVGAVHSPPGCRRHRHGMNPCREVRPRQQRRTYPVESEAVADEVSPDGPLMLIDELKEATNSPRPGALASSHAT